VVNKSTDGGKDRKGEFSMKKTKLLGRMAILALVLGLAFSLAFTGCPTEDDDGGGGGGDMVKFTITGLSPGIKYFITPVSGPMRLSQEDEYSGVADSGGSVSVSYQYIYLEMHGFKGDCYVEYHIYDDTKDYTSKEQYAIVAGANITLNAATDFEE
jgi:hypothetical protein